MTRRLSTLGSALSIAPLLLAACTSEISDQGALDTTRSALELAKFGSWTSIGSPTTPDGPGAIFGTATVFPEPVEGQGVEAVYAIGKDFSMYSHDSRLSSWASTFDPHKFHSRPAVATWSQRDPTQYFDHNTVVALGFSDGPDEHGLWMSTDWADLQEMFGKGWARIGTETFAVPFISEALVSTDTIGPAIASFATQSGLNLIVCAMKPIDSQTHYQVYCSTNADSAHGFPAPQWQAPFQAIPNDTLPAGVFVTMGPALASNRGGGLRVVVGGSDGHYYTTTPADITTFAWSPWTSLQAMGVFLAEPGIANHGAPDIFGLGSDNQIAESTLSGTALSQVGTIATSGVPPFFTSGPSACAATGLTSGTSVRVDVTAIGRDDQVYLNTWQGTSSDTTLAFDDSALWTSPQVGLSANPLLKTQGDFGLNVPGSGYRVVNSAPLRTPLPHLTSNLRLDTYIPGNQPNPYWLGAVQTYATCASANLNNAYIGQVELTGKPTKAFSTLPFSLPANVKAALGQTHSDCFFSIAVNANQTPVAPVLDNLRFVP